jgi:dTDP-4-dehydrorhamnose reductase
MLGSGLCSLLHEEHIVLALHRDAVCYARHTQELCADLSDKRQVENVLKEVSPEVVIHCAGLVDVDYCETNNNLAHESNVIATENILSVCGDTAKFVYISTDQVYGECGNRSESNEHLTPANVYGQTKYAAEQMVLSKKRDNVVVRTNVFGWSAKPGKVSSAEKIFDALKNRKELVLFDDYFFSPIYSICLGELLISLLSQEFSGIINIGSSVRCSKYEFGMEMARLMACQSQTIRRGSILNHSFLARRPSDLGLPVTKCEEMGLSIPSYSDSLRQYLDDFQSFA